MNVAICNNKNESNVEILSWFDNYGQLRNECIYVDVFATGAEMISNIKSGENYDLILIYCDIDNNGYECGPYLRDEMSNQEVELVYVLESECVPMQLANSKPLILLKSPLCNENVGHIIDLFYKSKRDLRSSYICKNNKGSTLIPYKDIMYIYSRVRVLSIVTKDKTYTCYDKIKKFPGTSGFYQINKSYIINANYLEIYSKSKVIMVDGTSILISRNFKDEVRELLERYVIDNAVRISE